MKYVLAILAALALPAAAKVKTEVVEYKQGDAVLQGYLCYDDAQTGKRPGILVIHDWMGVSNDTKSRAEMLAGLGYVALTADIYGKGVRPANAQEAQAESGKFYKDRGLLRARARAGLDFLASRPQVDAERVGVMGYCFGGGAALELARSGAPVKGTVTFHGALATPTPEDAKNIKGKVLVLHGADDPYVKQTDVTAFMDEMRKGGVDWELVQYSGAVHSFTIKSAGNDNSKGAAYNAEADRRSWEAMKEFWKETLQGM
ncbi:MAG TPA: dienelactone hydrolase family protein [Bacteroidota bacterium]|nr:dienelactone hydrolase family protein [Bacteroidota bacterium]